MGWKQVGLLGLVLLVACKQPKTPSERCRLGNAIGRIGKEHNRVADAIEDARCDQLEAEERAGARERAREEKENVAHRAALQGENDALLTRIRQLPKTPELGATNAEAKVICERQRGLFETKGATISCSVGGPVVFVALLESNRVTRLDTYYEGGDLTEARRTVSDLFGPHEREELTPDGFRAFIWKQGTLVIAMYPRGVRMSTTLATSPTSTSDEFTLERK